MGGARAWRAGGQRGGAGGRRAPLRSLGGPAWADPGWWAAPGGGPCKVCTLNRPRWSLKVARVARGPKIEISASPMSSSVTETRHQHRFASPVAIIAATVERWFWRSASSGGRDCAAGAAECLVAGGGGCCGYRDGGVLVLATALLWRRRHARRGEESVEGAVG